MKISTALLSALLLTAPVWAEEAQPDPLTREAERMNQELGKGNGTAFIENSMAKELAEKDPTAYPTTEDALKKIESMRASKMGYGKIANELGLRVGPIMREARHERNRIRRETRGEKPGRPESAGRPDKPSKPEKAPKPEKSHGNPHK